MSESHTALTVTARAALGGDKARTELAELVKKSANILALSWLIDLDFSPLLDRYEGAVA